MKGLKQADREQKRIEMKIYRKNEKELGWLNEVDQQQHSNENPEKRPKRENKKNTKQEVGRYEKKKRGLRSLSDTDTKFSFHTLQWMCPRQSVNCNILEQDI